MLTGKRILTALLMASIPTAVLANGLTPPVIGGNFASPVELNPTDVYWNPGALGQLRGTHIFLNVAPTFFTSGYNQGATYPTTVSMSLFSPVPILGVSSDFGLESLTFALAGYPSFGGETHWPADGPQRYQGSESAIASYTVTPSLAWRILPNLSIGAGASYVYNSLSANMSQDVYQYVGGTIFTIVTQCSSPEDPRCEARVGLKNATGSSFGWNAGVFYSPIPDLDLGLSYVSQVIASLTGDIALSPAPGSSFTLSALIKGAKGNVKVTYTLPQFVNFGLRYRVVPGWQIDALARWFNWKVHKSIDLDISGIKGATADFINGNQSIVRGYQNAFSGRLGAIYNGLNSWRIIGAVGYDQSGIPDGTMSASNLEFDKVYIAAAFEHDFTGHLKAGFGLNHAFLFPRTISQTDLTPPDAYGTYKGTLEVVDVTVAYRF